MDPTYIFITLVAMGASHFVGMMLKKRFAEFSQLPIPLSGRDVAHRMLRDAGVPEVEVTAVGGQLTDHYNPQNKTVNLSEVVFMQNNVAAAAVAAHECGHAVQHKTAYPFLKFRSAMVPLVQLSNTVNQFLLMIGLALAAMGGNPGVLLVGIVLFAITTLFSFITLPVEFDASARALKWMESSGLLHDEYHEKAKKALFWAAMTYTVAALSQLGQLVYFISFFLNAQQRD